MPKIPLSPIPRTLANPTPVYTLFSAVRQWRVLSGVALTRYPLAAKPPRIPAIEGIDTRKLTLHIRDKGALRGGIFRDKNGAVDRLLAHPKMEGLDLASVVSCKTPYNFGENDQSRPLVGVYDYGVKLNILRLLVKSGFSVRVYPSRTPLDEALRDGVADALWRSITQDRHRIDVA